MRFSQPIKNPIYGGGCKGNQSIVATITVLIITVVALGRRAQHDVAIAAQNGTEKIESLLLDNFAANGSADFLVVMTDQADLSAAAQLPSKLEKGQYLFNTLVATAERTQCSQKAYLNTQSLT